MVGTEHVRGGRKDRNEMKLESRLLSLFRLNLKVYIMLKMIVILLLNILTPSALTSPSFTTNVVRPPDLALSGQSPLQQLHQQAVQVHNKHTLCLYILYSSFRSVMRGWANAQAPQ